jgi:Domain of unknown function (DUF5666)
MANDETRPLPADGTAPTRAEGTRVDAVDGTHGGSVPPAAPPPPSPWATTQPVVPAPPSPYGPAEPDPWVDITPGRVDDGPAFGAPGPRPGGQGRRVLGMIGLVAAGAVAGGLIVNAIGGLGGLNTAAVQPAGVGQNGTGPNGVAPGGGVQGGAPGAQGGVPGGAPGDQGLRGGFAGQDGEQRLTGTLTAVSASRLTVRTSSGSATYQVVSQTQVVRNGALASASDLKVGDRVLVHVFPADGSDGVLERVIAVAGSATRSGTAGRQDAEGTDISDT